MPSPPRRWRLVAARAALVVMSMALAVGAGECTARYAFRDVRSGGDERTYFARRAPKARRNQLGFREREVPPKNGYRIAVIGDSLTWGQGIDEHERFSNLVGDALGDGYEVFNFGVRGRNMQGHGRTLRKVLTISPDFVLLQLFINDWEARWMARPRTRHLLPWPSLERALLRSSVLYGMLETQWSQVQVTMGLTESYPRYMERHLRNPRSRASRAAYDQLRRLVGRARAAGVPIGIVLFPSPSDLGTEYPFGYVHDQFRAVCQDEGIPCLDLRGPLAENFRDPRAMWVSRFDHHPSAQANRVAAAAIMDTFGPVWRQQRANPGASRGRDASPHRAAR